MAVHKIGEIFIRQGLITTEQLAMALEEQKKSGLRLSSILIAKGILKDAQILRAMEKNYATPGVDVSSFQIDASLMQIVPKELCDKHVLIPLQKAGNTLVVAFTDPTNLMVKEDLRFLTKLRIQPVVGTESAIQGAIDKYYGAKKLGDIGLAAKAMEEQYVEDLGSGAELIEDDASGEEAPIIKFVNAILVEAIKKNSSDIHFEPYEKNYRVRFRIDGILIEQASPPVSMTGAISSRLKIMSKLDIAERRKPQDGRLKVKTKKGKEIDFRVSVLPTLWGEKICLRILDKSNLQLDMTRLGLEEDDLKVFKHQINLPQGLVLITGPTGSGKTTTIYSALAELNIPDVNISTAEDPVEFNLEGINQVQMNPDVDLTFASSLKSFLRQDPDIIMVGEIRDYETAEIAFKAASTGHLVVSTLHTNDAPSTVVRLTEMGVAPYLITSTINLIVAQRLVGRVCEGCRAPIEVPPQALINIGVPENEVGDYKLYKGKGCTNCNGTGIKGRVAIYELMTFNETIKEAILAGASMAQLRSLARESGLKTLRRAGLLKLKRGITTIEEVLNASVKDT